ncbi:hypothetical protein HNV12_08870 [Methanococcoides sp. SA1]|nr:hypothetical protein [Methanococcoides sp. SA1]
MADQIVLDQYKEMVEKTKQLHSELVELSSKMGVIADTIDNELPERAVSDKFGSIDPEVHMPDDPLSSRRVSTLSEKRMD